MITNNRGEKIHTGEIPITPVRFHVGNRVKVKSGVLSHFENQTGEVIRIGRSTDTDIEILFPVSDRVGKFTSCFSNWELELT